MVKQRMIAMMPRLLAILAVVVILGATLGAGSALADKPVDGIHHHAKKTGNVATGATVATLTLAPNPVGTDSGYVVTGSGFKPNTFVTVGIREPDEEWWQPATTDGSGSFSFTWTADSLPGSVVHDAYQPKNSGRYELMASATLTVVAP